MKKGMVIAMYICMSDDINAPCITWHIIIHNDKSTCTHFVNLRAFSYAQR